MVDLLIFTLLAAALWIGTEYLGRGTHQHVCEECGIPVWNLHVWKQKLICGRCMETKS